jgi:hypothetical protein
MNFLEGEEINSKFSKSPKIFNKMITQSEQQEKGSLSKSEGLIQKRKIVD